MPIPTNLTVTYNTSAGSPAVTNVASASVTLASLGGDLQTVLGNINIVGGFLFADPSGVQTFVPATQIVKITAQ